MKILKKYQLLPLHVKASGWFLMCSFLQRGVSVITTPIFTRLMTTTEYGEFSVFNSWSSIFVIFITLNISYEFYTQGLIKYSEKDQFTSSMQGLTFVLCMGGMILYYVFNDSINRITSLNGMQTSVMIITIWGTAVCNFWIVRKRIELNYVKLIFLTLAMTIMQPILSIYLIHIMESSVNARILSGMIVTMLFAIVIFCKQVFVGKTIINITYWKIALLYSIPLVPHYLSNIVLNSADRIMINNMVGASEAGIYSLAYSISSIMLIFNQALLQTIQPWIFQKIKDNKIDKIANVAYASLIVIAFVNILLIAFAPEIVRLFAPEKYCNAIWIIPPVAMCAFFMFMYNIFTSFEFYYQKNMYILIASVAAAVLNILLNYIFIDIFGYYAAGYTSLICYMIYAVGHFCFMSHLLNTLGENNVFNIKILIIITLSFGVIGAMYLFSYKNIIVRYSLTAILILLILLNWKKCKKYICFILRKDK